MNTDRYNDYYHHSPETWTAAQCEEALKRLAKDGLGTPYPQRGMFPELKHGPVRYNGGTSRFDKWYQGEVFTLPVLPTGYAWVYVPTWCWKIVKEMQSPVCRERKITSKLLC